MMFDPRAIGPRFWYLGLIGLVALQRVGELILSERHIRKLEACGAREVGARHFRWMVIGHAAFLVSSALEPWLGDRHFQPVIGSAALAVLAAAQLIRYWTIRSLGVLWTARVMAVPGVERIRSGPYRWIRHPVYLVVAVEIVALPMVFGGWMTAVTFSLVNSAILAVRITVENSVLDAMPLPVSVEGEPSCR